jgi:20S proteasome alpha/beta subunit
MSLSRIGLHAGAEKLFCRTRERHYYPGQGEGWARLPPRRDVTIAAGFRCRNGVVLCADSRITVPNISKYEEPKIATLLGIAKAAFYTFEGDVGFSKMAIEMLAEKMHEAEVDGRSMVKALRQEVLQIHKDYSNLHSGKECLYLSLLLAIQTGEDKIDLFRVEGPRVIKAGDTVFIGCGGIVASSAVSLLYDREMCVLEAARMAAMALLQAKTHVDGCGGRSEVVRIFSNGSNSRMEANEIKEAEDRYREFLRAGRAQLLAS